MQARRNWPWLGCLHKNLSLFQFPVLRNYPADKGLKAFGIKQTETVKSGVDYTLAIKSPVFYALIVFAFLVVGDI